MFQFRKVTPAKSRFFPIPLYVRSALGFNACCSLHLETHLILSYLKLPISLDPWHAPQSLLSYTQRLILFYFPLLGIYHYLRCKSSLWKCLSYSCACSHGCNLCHVWRPSPVPLTRCLLPFWLDGTLLFCSRLSSSDGKYLVGFQALNSALWALPF